MIAKIINLNFDLKDENGVSIGNAGDACGRQMNDSEYIKRMQNQGNTVFADAMIRARDQAIVEPHELALSDEEFAIVRDWLVVHSGYAHPYEHMKTQLLAAFDA